MYIAFPGMIRRDPLLNIRRRERESAGGLRGELRGGVKEPHVTPIRFYHREERGQSVARGWKSRGSGVAAAQRGLVWKLPGVERFRGSR